MLELKSRLAILDQNDAVVGFLDNDLPDSLFFWDDELHEYLEGTSNTFTFKTDARHADSINLCEGYKIAFRTNQRDYYLNVMILRRDEDEVEIEAWSGNLELLNEKVGPYDPSEAMSFEQYLNSFDPEHTVSLGINEVSDKRIKNKWDGDATVLSRLYSLANVFSAEIEFAPELNDDYSLKHIVMNVYREHSSSSQGIGKANSLNLRYGHDIKGIKKTADITDLYTCIRPWGSAIEGSESKIDISGLEKVVKNEEGQVEYFVDGNMIRAPLARDRFPSYVSKSQDRYVLVDWDCDVKDKETLYGRALAELKKNSQPKVTYEIDGYADTGIGDTVRITDEEYNPILYLEARVTEQIRSFTDESRNKTIYSNINVLQSQIDSSLISRVEKLIQQSKVYIGEIITDHGIQFVNGVGQTTLTARVLDGVVNVASKYTIKWYKDGTQISTDTSVLVESGDFAEKAVYSFEAYEGSKLKARAEVTLTNVNDGPPGSPGQDGKPTYLHIRYSNDGGQTFTGNNGKTEGKWMGTYTDHLEADSEKPSDYTWIRIRGNDGQSLVEYKRQYYLSTSDTTQTGGAWLNTYPDTYDKTKYLWTRQMARYENPDQTSFSVPELDSVWTQTADTLSKAQDAIDSANQASQSASNAVTTANQAKADAQAIQQQLGPIQQDIDNAKALAQEAKEDVEDTTQQILTDISGTYATKTEVTTIEGDLQTQITANANGLATKVSETVYQQNKKAVDDKLADYDADLAQKQKDLNDLTSKQSQAEQDLAKAKTDLANAQQAVDDLSTAQGTTQAQLDAAKTALTNAQQAVQKAQNDVDNAKTQINTINGEISAIQDDVDDLTSRTETNETAILQNSKDIALKASKTEVNTALNNAKAYTDAQIKVEADKISQTVSGVSTKVDGLTNQTTEYYYYVSTSNTTQTGGSWSTTAPTSVPSGKYLWRKEKVTFVSGTTKESAPVCMTGQTGSKGNPGSDGTSVTVSSTSVTYQKSSNGTTAPTGSWTTTIPATSAGEYLWTKTIVTYSDGKSTTAYSVSKHGSTGATGKGISNTATTYQASSSGTTVPTGTWNASIPTVSAGQYLWTRTITTYSDNTTSTSYSVGRNGINGTNGKDAIAIVVTSVNGLTYKNNPITTTLTAHVYKGGVELTDAQVTALGAIKWYKDGSNTAIATGKTLSVSGGNTMKIDYVATLEA